VRDLATSVAPVEDVATPAKPSTQPTDR